MFGKKRKKGPVEARLNENQFCVVIGEQSDDVTEKYSVIVDSSMYGLLYRDGQYMGMPVPYGGSIYPFAIDPRKPGTKRQKKQFHAAKVVCLSKAFNLEVFWGTQTPFVLEDKETHKVYEVGARGKFYVNIDPSDAARTANEFYSKLLTQRNVANFDPEALRNFLSAAFIMHIGAMIQEYVEDSGRSLANYVGLMPSEILKISQELCPKMTNIFGEVGLTIVEALSSGSILEGLTVNEVVRN